VPALSVRIHLSPHNIKNRRPNQHIPTDSVACASDATPSSEYYSVHRELSPPPPLPLLFSLHLCHHPPIFVPSPAPHSLHTHGASYPRGLCRGHCHFAGASCLAVGARSYCTLVCARTSVLSLSVLARCALRQPSSVPANGFCYWFVCPVCVGGDRVAAVQARRGQADFGGDRRAGARLAAGVGGALRTMHEGAFCTHGTLAEEWGVFCLGVCVCALVWRVSLSPLALPRRRCAQLLHTCVCAHGCALPLSFGSVCAPAAFQCPC